MAKKKTLRTVTHKIFTKRETEIHSMGGGILGIKIRTQTKHDKKTIANNKKWKRCIDYFKRRCAYCLERPSSTRELTKDHFIPKSKHGMNTIDNIVPACEKCNIKKGDKDPRKWCDDDQLERIYTYFWDYRIYRESIANRIRK